MSEKSCKITARIREDLYIRIKEHFYHAPLQNVSFVSYVEQHLRGRNIVFLMFLQVLQTSLSLFLASLFKYDTYDTGGIDIIHLSVKVFSIGFAVIIHVVVHDIFRFF